MFYINDLKEKIVCTEAKWQKLFWIFFVAAFIGDLIEVIFCYTRTGVLMSRSSVLYGPFSVVWGFGAVLLTITLHGLQHKDDRYIFIGGAFLGGAYEYLCSVLTEMVFGSVFWDYSEIPFNLNGRVNLLYCFFWGMLAILWVKHIYPPLSRLIVRISGRISKSFTGVLLCLMIVNILLSAAALYRYGERYAEIPPTNALEYFLDAHYDDAYLENRYPNMIMK